MSGTGQAMVVGAGVVGLACAKMLAQTGWDVVITEQHEHLGSEVSARNSGVIHAGIYYPQKSLKARCCVRGKQLLYDYCAEKGIPHRNLGKFIVGTNEQEDEILLKIRDTAAKNGVVLELVPGAQAMEQEPALSVTSALWSSTTGIVDCHELMFAYLGDAENCGAIFVPHTSIQGTMLQGSQVVVEGLSSGEDFSMAVDLVVNAAGLRAYDLAAQHWSDAPKPPQKFAKGNYFSISGKGPFDTLIYPTPVPGGLGIHYTADLGGRGRLGPNVRWVEQETYDVELDDEIVFREAVRRYWPGVEDRTLSPDYSGIRPKIAGDDFVIRRDGPIINLLGIESPGLTSSLAIGEIVANLAVNTD